MVAGNKETTQPTRDVVITRAIEDDPACKSVLERHRPASERFSIPLKGLSGEYELWRLTPRAPIK